MARKSNIAEQTSEAKLRSQLERYEALFGEIDSFVKFVQTEREQLRAADAKTAEAKAAYEEARDEAKALRESIAGSKDALFRLVEPGVLRRLPLFDRMEPADPDTHGEHAEQWRADPITALRLSPTATDLLIAADLILVGQLQDIVLADRLTWWETIEGMTAAVAAAVMDKLNDFIFRDGGRG